MNKPLWAIKFKLYCKKRNLTAKELATIMDVSVPTIYKYYTGKFTPKDEAKKKLEKVLGFDIYDIFYNPGLGILEEKDEN